MIIRSLNSFRNRLIAQSKYTDRVDDALEKSSVQRKRNSKSFIRRIDCYERNECALSKSRQLSIALYRKTKEQNESHIGVWAKRHRQYLKQLHRIKCYNLLISERLYPYLVDIEEQAQTMFLQLVKAFAEKGKCYKKTES